MKLKNAVYLVTGGAGFVGSHIVDLLIKENVKKVITLDNLIRGRDENLSTAKKTGKLQMVEGDIRDQKILKKIFKGVDIVFHQAALRWITCQENPQLAQEVMVDGTFNVLEACVKHQVKKLIFASSALVYGEPKRVPIGENHPLKATTIYGTAKIANEAMIQAFHSKYNLPYAILRYFNIYGPRMDIDKSKEVMIRWIEAIEKGQPPAIHGDGKSSFDFISIEDVARANILAAKSDLTEGIFNIATGGETTLSDLSSLLLTLLKSPKSLKQIYKKEIGSPLPSRRFANIKKAQHELGFKPTVDLEEGLNRLIEWRKMIQSQS